MGATATDPGTSDGGLRRVDGTPNGACKVEKSAEGMFQSFANSIQHHLLPFRPGLLCNINLIQEEVHKLSASAHHTIEDER
jgi:hypothetical protein